MLPVTVTRRVETIHAEVESRILGNENVRFGRGVTDILDQGSRSLPHQNLAEALAPVHLQDEPAEVPSRIGERVGAPDDALERQEVLGLDPLHVDVGDAHLASPAGTTVA